MHFKHLKTEACPTCGEREVIRETREIESTWFWDLTSKRKVRRHCNGQEWEEREFLCGYTTQWVPNFSREEQKRTCRTLPAFLLKAQQVEKLKKERTALDERIRAAEHELYTLEKNGSV
jgi:hypothetical protein